MYPERFSHLPEYAFPRLRALLDGHNFVGPQYDMTIGEPQHLYPCLLYTSPSPRDQRGSRMPSSA